MCIFHRWIYIVHTNVSLFGAITYICNANDCNKNAAQNEESSYSLCTLRKCKDVLRPFYQIMLIRSSPSLFRARRMQINFPIQENSCNSNFWIAVDIILMVALVAATIASLLLLVWQKIAHPFLSLHLYRCHFYCGIYIQIWVCCGGTLESLT